MGDWERVGERRERESGDGREGERERERERERENGRESVGVASNALYYCRKSLCVIKTYV